MLNLESTYSSSSSTLSRLNRLPLRFYYNFWPQRKSVNFNSDQHFHNFNSTTPLPLLPIPRLFCTLRTTSTDFIIGFLLLSPKPFSSYWRLGWVPNTETPLVRIFLSPASVFRKVSWRSYTATYRGGGNVLLRFLVGGGMRRSHTGVISLNYFGCAPVCWYLVFRVSESL